LPCHKFPENTLLLQSFEGQPDETCLLHMVEPLQYLGKLRDVRPTQQHIEKYFSSKKQVFLLKEHRVPDDSDNYKPQVRLFKSRKNELSSLFASSLKATTLNFTVQTVPSSPVSKKKTQPKEKPVGLFQSRELKKKASIANSIPDSAKNHFMSDKKKQLSEGFSIPIAEAQDTEAAMTDIFKIAQHSKNMKSTLMKIESIKDKVKESLKILNPVHFRSNSPYA